MNGSTTPPAADTGARVLFAAGNAAIWRLWTVGVTVFLVRWMETVAVGVFVHQCTGAAFLVAAMTMLAGSTRHAVSCATIV